MHIPGMRWLSIDTVEDLDPLHGVVWWQETVEIEAPDGVHIFRGHERLRLFTYWDILHYLQEAGFEKTKRYPDWKIRPPKKPKAEWLAFVSRKK